MSKRSLQVFYQEDSSTVAGENASTIKSEEVATRKEPASESDTASKEEAGYNGEMVIEEELGLRGGNDVWYSSVEPRRKRLVEL